MAYLPIATQKYSRICIQKGFYKFSLILNKHDNSKGRHFYQQQTTHTDG